MLPCASNGSHPFGQFCAPDLGYRAIRVPSSAVGEDPWVTPVQRRRKRGPGVRKGQWRKRKSHHGSSKSKRGTAAFPQQSSEIPRGDSNFGVYSFSSISRTCLQNRTCPSEVAPAHSDRNEGCFCYPTVRGATGFSGVRSPGMPKLSVLHVG